MKILILINILVFSLAANAKPCQSRIGALDIGSGSTKAFAAEVDLCKKKILKSLLDEKIPIAFKENLEKSSSQQLSTEILKEATAKISSLLDKMKSLKVDKISAVATSAFRSAKNGVGASKELSENLKIPIQILTPEEEAKVGALSALSQAQPPEKEVRNIIVWDIGGGSMQMWAQAPKKDQLHMSETASISFKNRIIQEIQNKDPQKQNSPNPIGKDVEKVVDLALTQAKKEVPDYFKAKSSKARWLGIGGVLSLSVQKQVNPSAKSLTAMELEKTLKARANLADPEISGDYKSTEISNLALVLGYMKALNIKKIETFDASLTQGWIYQQLSQDKRN